MEEKVITQVDKVLPKSETEVQFGAISQPTPIWAKWFFRGTLIVTSVVVFTLASDPGIPDEVKIRATVYLKALDLLVFGFSKMFGIVPNETT